MLRDGAMRVGTAAAFFAVGTVIALTIILPLYAQLALGLSVVESALDDHRPARRRHLQLDRRRPADCPLHPLQAVPIAGLLLRSRRSSAGALADRLFAGRALGLIAVVGLGLGPMFPFTIVVVQNAVALHQLGVVTGTMNFFRALGSTFIVAGFGAIVLAGAPAVRGASAGAVLAGAEAAEAFRWAFAAAALCHAIALACILTLEERPMRGSCDRRGRLRRARAGLHSCLAGAARCHRCAAERYRSGIRELIGPPTRDGMTSSSRKARDDAVEQPAARCKAGRATIFYGLMLAMFLSALNQTIVATALPTIGRDFGDFENLSWVIIAYLLSSTVVSPLYGKLSDIHGRRAMMLAGIGLFIAGSAASAAAPDMGMLIAGRTPAGHRRRRHRAAHADHHRRHGHAARARPLPGLYGNVLDRGRGRRPGARRLHRRPPALVGDLLAQRAARAAGGAAHPSCT